MTANPFNWQSHKPKSAIARPQKDRAIDILRQGGSAYVLAGRGMGKSVFLQQLEEEISSSFDTLVVRIPAPPLVMTVEKCLAMLTEQLHMQGDFLDLLSLFDAYFRSDQAAPSVVLLFDEYDRYAHPLEHEPHPGRAFFSNLEAAHREIEFPLGILTAGGIGVYVFRDVLGSPFLSRAEQILLSPFDRDHIRTLAAPFAAERSINLEDETLEELLLASGGNPALVTHGLQMLWDTDQPNPRHVTDVFSDFRQRHPEFIRDIHKSFADPSLSKAPQRIWAIVREAKEPVPRSQLVEACIPGEGRLDIDFVDVLTLLQATGLVRTSGSFHVDDPIDVKPVASILNLPEASSPASGFRNRLLSDVNALLDRLYSFSADFFRPGGKGNKQLVPEAVFSAFLAMGLGYQGWQPEREAQSVAGKTDIKLRRLGLEGMAVIEVKIWGRNDYKDIHQQVLKYWAKETAVGMAIMITDQAMPEWKKKYPETCLNDVTHRTLDENFPCVAHFRCDHLKSDTSQNIEHLLLRLPRE